MSKKPAPMYGQKEAGRSVEDTVRTIKATLADHERAITHAQSIGRKYLDGVTLSEAGKSFGRTLDAYMDSRGMDRASLSARVTAMQELAPLRFSEDCSPGDLKLVLHQGVTEHPTAAPSSQPSRRQVDAVTFSDGTPVAPGDREGVARLGGPARYATSAFVMPTLTFDRSGWEKRQIEQPATTSAEAMSRSRAMRCPSTVGAYSTTKQYSDAQPLRGSSKRVITPVSPSASILIS